MSDGNHDEDEAWLLARERGIPGTPAPEARAALYSRLDALVADLPEMPSGFVPRPGWQQRLLVALGEPAPPRESTSPTPGPVSAGAALPELAATPAVAGAPEVNAVGPRVATARRRRWGTPAVGAALAAALAIVVVGGTYYQRAHEREPDARPFATAVAVRRQGAEGGGPSSRSRGSTVGDDLLVRAVVGGSGELRVYGEDGVEKGRCAAPGLHCSVEHAGDRTTLVLRMPVQAVGELRAFLFSPALGGSSAGLEADVAAAVRARIVVTPLDPVRFLESAPVP